MTTKICRSCKKTKTTSEFWKAKGSTDGLAKDCIECSKAKWAKRVTREKKDQYNERAKRFDDYNIARYLLRQARKRAKAKGLVCTITPSDIHVDERCPVLGVPLSRNRGRWDNHSYSLDRVDSTRGYVPGNVRVISWWANYLKSNLTIEQVENLLKYMKGEK